MAGCRIEKAAPGEVQESGFTNAALAGCETQFTAKLIDFQSHQGVADYRRRWVRRRIPVGPELAAFLADMALGEAGQ